MGYKLMMSDGSTVTIDEVASQKKDGSGTYLFDADGKQVASFADGTVKAAYPTSATVTEPAAAPQT